MNNYIVLDWKRYKVPVKQWQPVVNKPATTRVTLLGDVDATFGAAVLREWQGVIEGPVEVPAPEWGTVDDLRATLAKRTTVTLIDHYEHQYEVVCLGPFKEDSFMGMWDSSENHIRISARILQVRQTA